MVERGILCLLIGVAVIAAPYFLPPSGTRDMIAGAVVVGWFAVVLGAALTVVALVQRAKGRSD